MPNLLVEVGTEEVPAAFVRGALEALPALVRETLQEARLTHGAVRVWGTPRRIAFAVDDLADRQPDRSEEVTGPPASVAIGPDGKLTKAGEGFAKKMGVAADGLRVVETPKGPYVAAVRSETGRGGREVLGEALPGLLGRIPFPKSMRWEVNTGPFARPVHWILARLGGEVLPFHFAGVLAGGTTRGHRFLAPGPVEAHDAAEYVEGLRRARVIVDPHEREALVRSELARAGAAAGGGATPVPDDALVTEVTFLVEQPTAVLGRFDAALLALPRAVLLSAMRGHQRCFALADAQGALHPAFLTIANTCEDPEQVRKGNETVIRARLADAQFFFDQDRKHRLEDRLPALDGMTFQARLGSMGDRARRAKDLAVWLAEQLAPDARGDVARAAELAKADLTTHLVGEFPDLQGTVGESYATSQGERSAVAAAIGEQYLPRGAADALPASTAGALLSLADRLVVLAGGFAAGLQPTGTADPFGLRRACIGVVRILWERQWSLSLREAFAAARWQPTKGKVRPDAEVDDALVAFFAGRLRALLADDAPPDFIEACLAAGDDDVLDLRRRVTALARYRNDPGWAELGVAFRRAWNITKDLADAGAVEVDPARFDSAAERALYDALVRTEPAFRAHAEAKRYADALAEFGRELKAPIDRFFTEVFVMVDDEAVRSNRLRLLRRVVDLARGVAHLQLLGGDA